MRFLSWVICYSYLFAGCGPDPEEAALHALRAAAPAEFEAWRTAVDAMEVARRAAGQEALAERKAALEWATNRYAEAQATHDATVRAADSRAALEVERTSAVEAQEVRRTNAQETTQAERIEEAAAAQIQRANAQETTELERAHRQEAEEVRRLNSLEAAEIETVDEEEMAAIMEANRRERAAKPGHIPMARAAVDEAVASAIEAYWNNPQAMTHDIFVFGYWLRDVASHDFGSRFEKWKPGMVSWQPNWGEWAARPGMAWAAPVLEAHRKAWAGYHAVEEQADASRLEARSRADAARQAIRTRWEEARREPRSRADAARQAARAKGADARREAKSRADAARQAARAKGTDVRREARMRSATLRKNREEAAEATREEAARREQRTVNEAIARYDAAGTAAVLAFEAAAESEDAARRRLIAAAPEAWGAYVAAQTAQQAVSRTR